MSQSTPYIGHPAYKAMGGRAGYTLATGLFIGLGGIFGYIAFMADALPKPALAPILVFVALDITEQSYLAHAEAPRRRGDARGVAVGRAARGDLPVAGLQRRADVGGDRSGGHDEGDGDRAIRISSAPCGVMVLLAHGFILTAMLWGGAVAFLIDRRITAAAATLAGVRACCRSSDSSTRSRRPAGSICRGRPDRRFRSLDGRVPRLRGADSLARENGGVSS